GGAGVGDGVRLVGDAALIQAGGAVEVDSTGLAGLGVGQGLVTAVADDGFQIFHIHLVDQGIPAAFSLHLVEVAAAIVNKFQVAVLAVLTSHGSSFFLRHGVQRCLRTLEFDLISNFVGDFHFPGVAVLFAVLTGTLAVLVAVGFGEGADPVLTGQILVARGQLVVAGMVELVGDDSAVLAGGKGHIVHTAVAGVAVSPD